MAPPTWLYPLLYILLQYGTNFPCLAQQLCHQNDANALLQFKQSLDINSTTETVECELYSAQDYYPKLISWNTSTSDCCKWDGVTCNVITGRVIGLDLSCSKLEGIIHPNTTIFQLSGLQKLNLAFNSFFESTISDDIGRLTALTHLNLSSSGFRGIIPSKLSHLPQLVSLDLRQNWELKYEVQDFKALVQNLTQIAELSLYGVNISSQLPTNWSSSLRYVDLKSTGVHGRLDYSVFNLPKLESLFLTDNDNLNVSLPKFNQSVSPLRELDLTHTNFVGDISENIGSFKFLTSLILSSCGVSGLLPDSIGNLSELTVLDLQSNEIAGKIPFSVFNLAKLEVLGLNYNLFSGPLPSNMSGLQKLPSLDFSNNALQGTIPSGLFSLQSLERLDLSKNRFSGVAQHVEFINKSQLEFIDLSSNALESGFPSWLFSLQALLYLDMKDNKLSGQLMEFKPKLSFQYISLTNNRLQGSIPKSISTLLSLQTLDLSSNNLSGTVEPYLFLNLNNLTYLDISNNRLSWSTENDANLSLPNLSFLGLSSCGLMEFPSFLENSTTLKVMQLGNNKLHDQVPRWVTSKPWNSLVYLNLSHNSLTSLEPLDLLAWQNLQILDLSFNQLQGPLPSSFCKLERLSLLDLSNNIFGGSIPECFGNLTGHLVLLNLGKNDLQGAISITFAETESNWLEKLLLNGNSLEGPLPPSLANCRYLNVLDVGNNKINDTFPLWLGRLKELQILVMRANRFFGPIDILNTTELMFPNMQILDLAYNNFTGVLPARLLETFTAMMSLEKSQTQENYSGNSLILHDPEVGKLIMDFGPLTGGYYYDSMSLTTKGQLREFTRIFKALVVIDLSSNKFIGDMPKVITNMKALIVLNLSHNEISGHIPQELGELSSLESLDLSWNKIEGEIPLQLTSLTSLAVLNLSQNHLVGRIPQGKQFDTFLNDSYGGNLELCGPPFTKGCEETEGFQLPPHQEVNEEEDDSNFMGGFTWKSVTIGYGCGIVLGFTIGNLMLFIQKPKWLVLIIERELYEWNLLPFGKKNKKPNRLKR